MYNSQYAGLANRKFFGTLMPDPGDVTELLQKASEGNRDAADALYRLVEKDMRAIAGRRKKHFENRAEGSTTELVDDAFVKILSVNQRWHPGDRTRFFSFVANKIHDLLVDAARSKLAAKRGGNRDQSNDIAIDPVDHRRMDDCDFMLDLKAALMKLSEFAPEEAQTFRIYYFLGSTYDETANIRQISATEAKRQLKRAQLWLQRELQGYDSVPLTPKGAGGR